jgi:hypothetical protein
MLRGLQVAKELHRCVSLVAADSQFSMILAGGTGIADSDVAVVVGLLEGSTGGWRVTRV